jgi:hypothetical protein
MAPKKPQDNLPATDSDFLEEYVNSEATQDLEERQDLDQVGRQALRRRLREHTAESPKLSGGDLDAGWDQANVGEEAVGGENPTPDQDVVDELGEGAGLTYQDDEPLNYNKVAQRDKHRWELNPASADGEDELEDEDEDEVEDDEDELSLLDGEIDETSLEVVEAGDEEDEDEDEAEGEDDDEDEQDDEQF